MNKLLLKCIIILGLGIVFVAGCIGEEKTTNTKTSTESTSSGHLINPTTLLKDYLSGNYKTYAMSMMDSFEAQIGDDLFSLKDTSGFTIYEGDVPSGKKRVATSFTLTDDEKSVKMSIVILESDTDSNFKKSYSVIEKIRSEYWLQNNFIVDRNLIGDYSFLVSGIEDNRVLAGLVFSNKNYLVKILTYCKDKEICRTETLKVAKEINSKID